MPLSEHRKRIGTDGFLKRINTKANSMLLCMERIELNGKESFVQTAWYDGRLLP